MSLSTTTSSQPQFVHVVQPFLCDPGLPFAEVLSQEQIQQTFTDEGVVFRQDAKAVYTPALTLWAFLGQVLFPDQSCRAAVARILVFLIALGRRPCSARTGAYCKARCQDPRSSSTASGRGCRQPLGSQHAAGLALAWPSGPVD